MAKQLFLNNFTSTFVAAVKDTPSSGTPATELDYGVLRLSDGAAGALINPTGGDYYVLTGFKRSGSIESNIEVMRVSAVDNSTPGECRITVMRAQEGTSAKAFVSGDYVSLRMTKGTAERFSQPDDLATKEPVITAGTSAQYWRGDKTWSDFFTDVRATTLTGLSTATSAVIAAADTVLGALGKLQAQITGHTSASSGAHAATAISNTPAGNIAATTVQAAINELDSEKQATLVSGTNIKTAGGQNLVGSGDAPIVAPETHAATSKTTPVDADELPLSDSAASWALKKLTFANLKAWITGLFVPRTGGSFGGGTDRGLVTFASAFGDGGSAANIALSASGTAQGQKAGVAFYPTFIGTADNGPRRAADIWSSFGGIWGTERLSFGVGRGGSTANDAQLATLETLALTAAGEVLAVRGPLGYGAGAGGTVTQTTSKSTSVTLNKPAGRITLNNAALGSGASVVFQVDNTSVAATDLVLAQIVWVAPAGDNYRLETVHVGASAFALRLTNISAGSLSDALQINFVVIKGVTS